MNNNLLRHIGLTADDYLRHRFEAGCAFAEYYYGGDRDVVLLITQCSAYWQWYNNHFNQADELFMKRYATTRAETQKLFELWEEHHSPARLTAFPNQYVIEQALDKVWSQAWKEEHRLNQAQITAKANAKQGPVIMVMVQSCNTTEETQVQVAVCNAFNVTMAELIGPSHSRRIAEARHCAANMLYMHLEYTQTATGRALGGRSHSTIYASLKLFDALYKNDTVFKEKADKAVEIIKTNRI